MNDKLQAPGSKFQAPSSNWNLEIGIWYFEIGFWNLVFGIWNLQYPCGFDGGKTGGEVIARGRGLILLSVGPFFYIDTAMTASIIAQRDLKHEENIRDFWNKARSHKALPPYPRIA